MPVIKSAIKKMRKDKVRTARNLKSKENLKSLLKQARRTPSSESFTKLSSALDKAVKTHLIHANKSARLKSRLNKLLVVSSPSK